MRYLEKSVDTLIGTKKRILITGGAGFIGLNLIIRLLKESSSIIFNLDKIGYASNLQPIEELYENRCMYKTTCIYICVRMNRYIFIYTCIEREREVFYRNNSLGRRAERLHDTQKNNQLVS